MPKSFEKQSGTGIRAYFIAPLVAAAIVLAAFALRGVYPFGSLTIDYFDMGQINVAKYCHLYDFLHGEGSFFYNWYTALGVSNASSSIPFFSFIFFFIPRSAIIKSLSFYYLFGASLSAFSMFFYLKKTRSLDLFWSVALSLCYAFCGYALLYYTNVWYDTVFLFPFLMYGFERLMKDGKLIVYSISLVLLLVVNYYLGFMTLVYLFFAAGLWALFVLPEESRGKCLWNLGLATVCSIGISMLVTLPKLMQTFSSQRFGDGSAESGGILDKLLEIYGTITFKSRDKWGMLILAALPCAIIIIGLIKNRTEKKVNLFHIFNILLIGVMIVVEGTCLIHHFGSYNAFPMRTGFILSFCLVGAASYYLGVIFKSGEKTKLSTGRRAASIVFAVVLAGGVFAALYLSKGLVSEYTAAFVAFAGLFAVYGLVFLLRKKGFSVKVVAAGLVAELVACVFLFVPLESFTPESTQNAEYFYVAQQLDEQLDIGESTMDRVKNTDMSLSPNYPYALRRAAVSDWTHTISDRTQPRLDEWGYSVRYTRLLDAGGTVFTDAVLNIKNILSKKDEPSALYSLVGSAAGYNYYSCRYTLPFGSLYADAVSALDGDWIDINNALYVAYSGADEQLVRRLVSGSWRDDSVSFSNDSYTLTVSRKSALYFSIDNAEDVKITLNGQAFVIPSTENGENIVYPAGYNKNVVLLGVFEDETVEIAFDYSAGENADAVLLLGSLDLTKLAALCDSYSSRGVIAAAENSKMTVETNAGNPGGLLVLPIQYDEGWSAKVNGESIEIKPAYGFLTAIDIPAGECRVVMSFVPGGLVAGAVISLASLVAFIFALIMKGKKLLRFELGERILGFAYVAVWAFAVLATYILPAGFFVVGLIKMYL